MVQSATAGRSADGGGGAGAAGGGRSSAGAVAGRTGRGSGACRRTASGTRPHPDHDGGLGGPFDPGASFMAQGTLPRDGVGVGMVEAARGALGHWLSIRNGRISTYQIIAPTTWNFSPRDADGVPGPLEAALEGTPVEGAVTLAVQHVVRSFDPCMVCTVH